MIWFFSSCGIQTYKIHWIGGGGGGGGSGSGSGSAADNGRDRLPSSCISSPKPGGIIGRGGGAWREHGGPAVQGPDKLTIAVQIYTSDRAAKQRNDASPDEDGSSYLENKCIVTSGRDLRDSVFPACAISASLSST
jgi:hypothetical protein